MGHRPTHTWFLEIVLFVNVGVCVCPPPREFIISHMNSMHNNQIRRFYGFSISLYDSCHQ